jgi:LysR family transcriptional regulator, regulator for metE and metH
MHLSREDLELVVAIAEEGTVTRAALRLHLSQSALSHHLRTLEERVGAALFQRGLRGMSLTPGGEAFVVGARRVCSELRTLEETLDSLIHSTRRTLRLGTECYTSYHWLPALVSDMARTVKDLELRIVIEATQRAKAALETGEVDAVILQSSGENPRVVYWPLFRDELVLVLNIRHRLAKNRAVQPADLAAETLILHQAPGGRHAVVDEFFVPARAYPNQLREVQLTEAIIEMVRAGLGVSVLARWLVEPHLRDGRIATVRLGKRGVWRDWRLAALRDHALLPEIDQLSRVLASAVKSYVRKSPRPKTVNTSMATP